jgi:HTH-type transcriptional regulator, transcriptional repressor of NAD biosynthesis genes
LFSTPKTRADMALTVTLLGGESSGKSSLAQSLITTLERQHGLRCVVVNEALRRWCQAHARTPMAHEQAAIAAEQTDRITQAAQEPGVDVVVADTTALMSAAYSEQYFQDPGLWAEAMCVQAGYTHTWLMGLDLPWQADGPWRDGPAAREHTDRLLRQRLTDSGLPYATLWGSLDERLRQALHTLKQPLGLDLADGPERDSRRPWRCEHCADPESEHRLFGFCPRTA